MKFGGKVLGNEVNVSTALPEAFDLKPGQCKVFVERGFRGTRLLIVRMDAEGQIRAVYMKPKKVL